VKYGGIRHKKLFSASDLKAFGLRHREFAFDSGTSPDDDSVHLFFQPRNALLYDVVESERRRKKDDKIVLWIDSRIISDVDFDTLGMGHVRLFDGDPGSNVTRQYRSTKEGVKAIGRLYKGVLDRGWWPYPDVNGVRRMAQAECILPWVDPKYIKGISVKNAGVEDLVRRRIGASSVAVNVDPTLFFDAEDRRQITERLSLVRGDMFFSRMQTLTVSVNLKGVMGAGVALRAKLQFPDVYVHYQNCCRRRTIKMGRPGLYQRELPIHYGLSPDAWHSTDSSTHRWFLLFATKTDWRHDSDVEGIKAGLQWIKDNYREFGITSLAVPALGCGNGNLSWQDMGPILCQELSSLDVPVEIYLPEGPELPEDHLNADYLLTSRSTR